MADSSVDSWPGIIEALRRRYLPTNPNAAPINWAGLPDQGGEPQLPGPFDDLVPHGQPQLSGVSPFQPAAAPPNLPPEEAQLYDILERNRVGAAKQGVYPPLHGDPMYVIVTRTHGKLRRPWGGKPEDIPAPRRTDPLLLRRKKQATDRKAKRPKTR
jgi:hypothetical protein